MGTSVAFWLAMVLNQLVCSSLLWFITVLAAVQLYRESQTRAVSETVNRDPTASPPSSPKGTTIPSSDPQSNSARNRSGSMSRRRVSNRFVVIFAAKVLAVCCSFVISNTVDLFSLFGLVNCHIRGSISSVFFQFGKMLSLTIFVDRLDSVFRGSVYEYRPRTLRSLYAASIVSNVVFCSLWLRYSSPFSRSVDGYRSGQVCVAESKHFVIPVLALLTDWALDIAALKMFTSPLRQMCKMSNEMDESTLAMARLARKTTVLSYVMFAVMFLGILIMVASQNYMAGRPAAVIYCTCLLLFPHWFDDWYPTLCSVPIAVSNQCCSLPKQISPTKLVTSLQRHVSSIGSASSADGSAH